MEEEEPIPKRPKISRGDDGYMPGNIIKIELCNFMSFDKLICKPCSRLNLVIGPNGSGKSSLVCAIALGLGGEPQLLGRAASIGAYVKFGEESGYITICLRGETKDDRITITRKINVCNKSEWLFNGKVVAKNEIKEVIQRYNIQVGNLTQFLPQDKVCEFAKLTPVQLLGETEKAVGDPQLPVQHETLVKKSKDLKNLERSVESSKGLLDQLKALNSELEKDVERIHRREELLKKVEFMKKKLQWLKHDVKKAEYVEAVKQEKDAQMRLNEAKDCLRKLKEPIEENKLKKTEQEAKCSKTQGLLDENMKKRCELLKEEMRLGVTIQSKYKEVKELKVLDESRQERIYKAEEELAAVELDLSTLPPFEDSKKIKQISAQIVELEFAENELKSKKSKKENQLDEHKKLLNRFDKRLNVLRDAGAEQIFEAYQWVKDNGGKFIREIYGPVFLEVNIANRFHADYLEGQVAKYTWKSFITRNDKDRDLLVNYLKPFHVPVINQEFKGRHKESFHPTREMQALGISTRLDQVFDAPAVVKECLIEQFGLDSAYVGSKETDKQASQAPKFGIMNLWTPENHYSWSRSRYDQNHISASSYPVHGSQLLLSGLDTGEIEKRKLKEMEQEGNISTLEASLKDLEVALTQNGDKQRELYRERKKIKQIADEKSKNLKDMKRRVEEKKRKLISIRDEPDRATAVAKLIELAKESKVQRFQCALKIKNLLVEAVGHRRRFAEHSFCSFELEAKIKEMESHVKQQEKLAKKASSNLEKYKRVTEQCKQQMLEAKDHAAKARITPELSHAFKEMPNTVEELQDKIRDTLPEANQPLSPNRSIVEVYKKRQEKIEELTDMLETDESNLKNLIVEINSLKESWLTKLRNLVTRINETFSLNFQEMAVAGEVSLDERDMDFDQYGILIKVKFRQTGKLQVLNAHHQSGGERAVSTIVYLVSLQDITNCPFRVVDEINQGMDPINERKMFQQLVRAASQPNTPQCFLLTPKLLPNLEYSDACSILNVMKGPWVESPSKVWSSGESWGPVRGVPMQNKRS